jgi:ribosomal protein S18 acetylase RimI-like enzyme
MRRRHEYFLELSGFAPPDPSAPAPGMDLRAAQVSDTNALAELMLEAYRDTIDYEGETMVESIAEVESWLAGKWGWMPVPDVSRLAFCGSRLASACLVSDSKEEELFFIAYVMTHPEWKRRGAARMMLGAVLEELRKHGYPAVRAVITEGNASSERLFAGMGFQKMPANSRQG